MRSSTRFYLIFTILVLSAAGCEKTRDASVSGAPKTADGPMIAQQGGPSAAPTPGDACDVPGRQLFIGTLEPSDRSPHYSPFGIQIWGDDAWHIYDSVLTLTPEKPLDLGENAGGWDAAWTKTNGTLQCTKLYKSPGGSKKTDVFCDIDLVAYHKKLPDVKD